LNGPLAGAWQPSNPDGSEVRLERDTRSREERAADYVRQGQPCWRAIAREWCEEERFKDTERRTGVSLTLDEALALQATWRDEELLDWELFHDGGPRDAPPLEEIEAEQARVLFKARQ